MSGMLPWILPLVATALCGAFLRPAGSVFLGLAAGWSCAILARVLLLRAANASWKRFGFSFLYVLLIHGIVFLGLAVLVFLKLQAPLPLLVSFSAVAMAGTVGTGCAFPNPSIPGKPDER